MALASRTPPVMPRSVVVAQVRVPAVVQREGVDKLADKVLESPGPIVFVVLEECSLLPPQPTPTPGDGTLDMLRRFRHCWHNEPTVGDHLPLRQAEIRRDEEPVSVEATRHCDEQAR